MSQLRYIPARSTPFRHSSMRRLKCIAPFVVLLASACGGQSGAGSDAGAPGGAPAGGAMQGLPVDMVTLAPKSIEDRAQFVGTLKSRRSSTIQPQAEGFITKILVKSGDQVSAGTPMFEIDASTQQAAVAGLESLRAAREADAAYAKQQADRAKRLLDAGAASQQELDQAITQQKNADAQLKAAQDQIRQQQAELAYYRVAAPASGVVGDVPVHVGDRVARTTELTKVDDNGGLEVYIGVPVQQASKLKVGLPVRLLDDKGEIIAEQRVNFIASSVSDDTQTVLVKTPVDRSRGQFRSDQTVRAEIVFDTAPGLTVPLVSVIRVNGQYFVFVAESGARGTVAKQRAVELGDVVGNEYIVKSGLKAGEKLVVGGIQKLGDGTPVMALPAAPATPPASTKPNGAGGKPQSEGGPASPKPQGEGGK